MRSWKTLAARADRFLASHQTQMSAAGRRRDARATPSRARGATNAQALLRLFDTTEVAAADSDAANKPGAADNHHQRPRVVLYRDRHAWCPYCQKVWMQLEEKRIPYAVEKINMRCYGKKSREYQRLVPSGMLPALELDGELITESDTIMARLERAFPRHTPLMPVDPSLAHLCEQLMQLERCLFSAWCGWLCRAGQDSRRRAQFEAVLEEVNRALELVDGGPFFCGAELTLPDIVFAPFLERMAASLFYYKGFRMKGEGTRWPCVARWFAAMERRETYRSIQSDFYTHVHDLPPQLGGCIRNASDAQKRAAAAIDGTDGVSWQLPLPRLDARSPEPLREGQLEDPVVDRNEAALALVRHRVAMQELGRLGLPLAKRRDADALQAVDGALRLVVQCLMLTAQENHRGASDEGKGARGEEEKKQNKNRRTRGARAEEATDPATADAEAAMALARELAGAAAISCAAEGAVAMRYIRDRINVPRDMGFLAARQLRAHLNAVADALDPTGKARPPAVPTRDRFDQDPARFGWQDTLATKAAIRRATVSKTKM